MTDEDFNAELMNRMMSGGVKMPCDAVLARSDVAVPNVNIINKTHNLVQTEKYRRHDGGWDVTVCVLPETSRVFVSQLSDADLADIAAGKMDEKYNHLNEELMGDAVTREDTAAQAGQTSPAILQEALERIRANQGEGYFTHPDIVTIQKAAEEWAKWTALPVIDLSCVADGCRSDVVPGEVRLSDVPEIHHRAQIGTIKEIHGEKPAENRLRAAWRRTTEFFLEELTMPTWCWILAAFFGQWLYDAVKWVLS